MYIHIYLEYSTYTKNKQGGYDRKEYKSVKGVYRDDDEHLGKSYQEEFETGIKDAYSMFVVGNKNDFGEGVNFSTKLVIHDKKDKDKEHYASDQQFLQVRIGGECPDEETEECDSNHWFHAYSSDYNVLWEGVGIYMPTNEQLKTDNDGMEDIIGYRECAAHELGHILGLDDAYYDRENKIDRLLENEETCFHLKNHWTNIMENSRNKIQMRANDIEMILLAYSLSFQPDTLTRQYYRKYELGEDTYPLSLAIKNKKDKEKEGYK